MWGREKVINEIINETQRLWSVTQQNGRSTKQAVRRWVEDATEVKLDRLKVIAAEGRRVEETVTTPGWKVVERLLKEQMQSSAEIAVHPDQPEHVRFRAACEHRALDAHLRRVQRLVDRGHKAETKVKELL